MLTKEEYAARAAAEENWAPGWEAIDEAFAAVYPGVEPRHMATEMFTRVKFGGDQYLDGCSIFPAPGGYQHLVTFGLSDLYADPEFYGGPYSGWGYELTAKVRAADPDEVAWQVDSLAKLALYTNKAQRFFEPHQFIVGKESVIKGGDSLLTSYLVVPDTEVEGRDTVHGRLDFLQLVGITAAEVDFLQNNPDDVNVLVSKLIALDPLLVTDLTRDSVV